MRVLTYMFSHLHSNLCVKCSDMHGCLSKLKHGGDTHSYPKPRAYEQATPEQVRSKELSELQAAASTMNVDVQIAKAASLQYQAVLEECRAVLNEWRHLVRMQLVHSARGIQ
jgi:hypothetical protein